MERRKNETTYKTQTLFSGGWHCRGKETWGAGMEVKIWVLLFWWKKIWAPFISPEDKWEILERKGEPNRLSPTARLMSCTALWYSHLSWTARQLDIVSPGLRRSAGQHYRNPEAKKRQAGTVQRAQPALERQQEAWWVLGKGVSGH